jgi:hypothetical protein
MSEEIRSDIDFVRDVLIEALDERRDELVGDLFDLYNRVRERENTPAPDLFAGLGNINISTTETADGTMYNFAAGDVAITGAEGQDVISFS